MSVFSFFLKVLGFAKSKLGKWLPVILDAEKKFKAATGEQKFNLVINELKKAVLPVVVKKWNEAGIKGKAATVKANAEINEYLTVAEKGVNSFVDFYNKLGILLPHSK